MAEEVKKIITVEVGKSITSVRDFKKHIEDLRGALLGLNEESEEYAQIAEQIATDQAKLNEVLRVGKTNTDAAAGSYIELNNQLKALRQQYRALSETERNSATGQTILTNINKLDTQLKNIDASMGQYQRNVGNYQTAFENAFRSIITDVGKLNPKFSEFTGVVAQLVPLFGKVAQAARISGQAMKAAMIESGIGLVIVLLGEVVAHWDKITAAINKARGKQDEYKDSTENAAEATKKLADEAARLEEHLKNIDLINGLSKSQAAFNSYLRAQGDEDTWKKRSSDLEKFRNDFLNYSDDVKNKAENIYTWWRLNSDRYEQLDKEVAKNINKIITNEMLAADEKQLNKSMLRLKVYFGKLQSLTDSETKKKENRAKEAKEEYDKEAELEAAAAKRRLKIQRESASKEEALRREKYESERDAIIATDEALIKEEERFARLLNNIPEAALEERQRLTDEHIQRRQYLIENNMELKELDAELNRDLQEIHRKIWESSDAYKKIQKEQEEFKELVKLLEKEGKTKEQILEEEYNYELRLLEKYLDSYVKNEDEKNAIILQHYQSYIAKKEELNKEFEDDCQAIIDAIRQAWLDELNDGLKIQSQVESQARATAATSRKFLNADNTIDPEAARARLDEIFTIQKQGYLSRIQLYENYLLTLDRDSEEFVATQKKIFDEWTGYLNTSLQHQSDVETEALHRASLQSTLNVYAWGGVDDVQKERDKQEQIFQIQREGYERRIELYREHLTHLEAGSDEYLETERIIAQTQMDLDTLVYEHSEGLLRQKTQDFLDFVRSAQQQVNYFGGIINQFTQFTMQHNKEGTEAYRSAQITQTIVSTLSGMVGAFSQAMTIYGPTPWGMGIGAAAATALGILGAMQVAKIKQANPNSGIDSSSSSSMSSVGVEPLLNEQYDLQRMTNLSLQGDSYSPGSTQVYVLESDIQEVGTRVQVREQNATF